MLRLSILLLWQIVSTPRQTSMRGNRNKLWHYLLFFFNYLFTTKYFFPTALCLSLILFLFHSLPLSLSLSLSLSLPLSLYLTVPLSLFSDKPLSYTNLSWSHSSLLSSHFHFFFHPFHFLLLSFFFFFFSPASFSSFLSLYLPFPTFIFSYILFSFLFSSLLLSLIVFL